MTWEQPPPPRRGGIPRNKLIILGFFGAVIFTISPIAIFPYFNPDYWRNKQKEAAQQMSLEKHRPPGVKEWSNPFEKPPKH